MFYNEFVTCDGNFIYYAKQLKYSKAVFWPNLKILCLRKVFGKVGGLFKCVHGKGGGEKWKNGRMEN